MINAPEPAKFYGHGICDNVSRSVTINRYINNPEDIYQYVYQILLALNIPTIEIRGVGIHISKFDFDEKSFNKSPSKFRVTRNLPMKRSVYDPNEPPGWLQQMYDTNVSKDED